jgi:hypothetical protein
MFGLFFLSRSPADILHFKKSITLPHLMLTIPEKWNRISGIPLLQGGEQTESHRQLAGSPYPGPACSWRACEEPGQMSFHTADSSSYWLNGAASFKSPPAP